MRITPAKAAMVRALPVLLLLIAIGVSASSQDAPRHLGGTGNDIALSELAKMTAHIGGVTLFSAQDNLTTVALDGPDRGFKIPTDEFWRFSLPLFEEGGFRIVWTGEQSGVLMSDRAAAMSGRLVDPATLETQNEHEVVTLVQPIRPWQIHRQAARAFLGAGIERETHAWASGELFVISGPAGRVRTATALLIQPADVTLEAYDLPEGFNENLLQQSKVPLETRVVIGGKLVVRARPSTHAASKALLAEYAR